MEADIQFEVFQDEASELSLQCCERYGRKPDRILTNIELCAGLSLGNREWNMMGMKGRYCIKGMEKTEVGILLKSGKELEDIEEKFHNAIGETNLVPNTLLFSSSCYSLLTAITKWEIENYLKLRVILCLDIKEGFELLNI